ncbi:MAG: hypothetical protein KAW49_00320, partial [Anaerolineae bacterium]|nr:hypothetical protein [Anaerolineae bacterium]
VYRTVIHISLNQQNQFRSPLFHLTLEPDSDFRIGEVNRKTSLDEPIGAAKSSGFLRELSQIGRGQNK